MEEKGGQTKVIVSDTSIKNYRLSHHLLIAANNTTTGSQRFTSRTYLSPLKFAPCKAIMTPSPPLPPFPNRSHPFPLRPMLAFRSDRAGKWGHACIRHRQLSDTTGSVPVRCVCVTVCVVLPKPRSHTIELEDFERRLCMQVTGEGTPRLIKM